MAKFLSWHIDLLGFSVSFLCAIHCLLIPIFLAAGVFSSDSLFSHELVEYIIIPASLLIAGWALFKAFQKHNNIRPLLIALSGFLIILASYLIDNSFFHYLIGMGGLLIAIAHFYNWRLLHQKTTN